MQFTHKKCGRRVEVGFFKGGKCKRCNRRWLPFMSMFALDLLPAEARSEKQERKTREALDKMAGKQRSDRKQHGDWAENIGPAKWVADKLPNWPRWLRILVSVAVLGSIIAGIVWMLS